MHKRRTLGLTVACALLISACGGADNNGNEPGAAPQPAGADGGNALPDPTATPDPAGRDGTAAPAGRPDQRGIVVNPDVTSSTTVGKGDGGSTTTTVPRAQRPPAPLEATLANSCIRAGSTQTITIKALAGGGVVYDSYYADGKSGISEGFYGGNNGAVMPESGTWSDTWAVAATAPPGKVTVIVQASKVGYKPTTQEYFFELVGPTGACP